MLEISYTKGEALVADPEDLNQVKRTCNPRRDYGFVGANYQLFFRLTVIRRPI